MSRILVVDSILVVDTGSTCTGMLFASHFEFEHLRQPITLFQLHDSTIITMCTSAETTFAWVGTVLINLGFLSLISWGAVNWWPLGCFLSGVYTVFLFSLAAWMDTTNQTRVQHDETSQRDRDLDYSTVSMTVPDEDMVHADANANAINVEVDNRGQDADRDIEPNANTVMETSQQLPTRLSLIYGLAVVALGVTLFFIPINLFACHDSSYEPSNGGTWTTDTSSFPRDVQQWVTSPKSEDIRAYATFDYLPASGVTIFAGKTGDSNSNEILWSVNPLSSKTAPEAHANVSYPEAFLHVTDNTTCFYARHSGVSLYVTSVACFDGAGAHWAVDEQDKKRLHNSPSHLIVSDGLLWFKEPPVDYTERGMLIFSLDPNSLVQTLHSELSAKPGRKTDKPHCNVKAAHRRQAISALFMVALPVLMLSILLWQRRKIPSMGLLTYAGATLVFWATCISIAPELTWGDSIAKWWLTLSGLGYLIALVYLILMVPAVASRPLVWGINAGVLAFIYGISTVYMSEIGDNFGSWLLLTLTAFVPVALLGAATDNLFLSLIGATGLFADSLRFAMFLSDQNGGTGSVPIIFFVLAIAGLGIGAMGMLLTRNQDCIREAVVGGFSWLETQAQKCFATEPPRQDHADNTPLVAVA
jgi:hypothetical protein